jgi:hypothetical protein
MLGSAMVDRGAVVRGGIQTADDGALSWHQRYDTDHARTWLPALTRTALATCGAS